MLLVLEVNFLSLGNARDYWVLQNIYSRNISRFGYLQAATGTGTQGPPLEKKLTILHSPHCRSMIFRKNRIFLVSCGKDQSIFVIKTDAS
jgi:hypothetical protein